MWRPWENDFMGIRDANDHNNRNNIVENEQQPPAEEANNEKPPEAALSKGKRKFGSYDEKKFIFNIYNKVKSEGEKQPLDRTAEITGTPRTTVWRIVNSGPQKRKIRCDKGTFKKFIPTHEDLVRRNIYELYKK